MPLATAREEAILHDAGEVPLVGAVVENRGRVAVSVASVEVLTRVDEPLLGYGVVIDVQPLLVALRSEAFSLNNQ